MAEPQSVLTDGIFGVVQTDDPFAQATLPDILSAVDAGTLIDLTGMQAHQRGPVVTTFAIIRAALRLYMPKQAAFSADEYRSAWVEQIGADAGRVSAPVSEVAFFQPPLLVEPHLAKTLDAVDVAFTDVRHEVKGSGDVGDAEAWIYAMMSGMLRIYVKDNVSGSRWGTTMILPGDGVTIGSEILHLSEAYLEMAAKSDFISNLYPTQGASAADHLVFLQPVGPDTPAIPMQDLPFPFLEPARAIRLYAEGNSGDYSARQMTLRKPRVDVKAVNENILDPHIPIGEGRPYRLIKSRRYGHRFVATILFAPEKGDVQEKPYTLSMNRQTQAIRICALRTDQGKTTGYYESLIRLHKKKLQVGLGKKDAQPRLSGLSAYGIRATADIQAKAVYAAAAMMDGGGTDISAAAGATASDSFRAAMDDLLVQWILDRAAEPEDLDADKASYAAIAVPAATKAVQRADQAAVTASPLFKARAWDFFRYAMTKSKNLEGYNLMKDAPKYADTLPPLVNCVGAIMASLAGRIKADPSVTKTLRTMAVSSRPIVYWRLAQEFPTEIVGGPACDVILKGLGSIEHANGGTNDFGAILARASFPENRMDRLVTASGDTLRMLADEAWRFAEAKGTTKADWRALAGLLIADEMADYEAASWYQRRLALEFVRVPAARDVA